jgi:DNA-binding FadR family transcriptional regulator
VIDVLELRLAVETEAASLAAQRRKAADLRAMRLALQAFETALASGQPAVEHDLAFHMAIARATGNQRFEGLMTALGEGAIPRARLSTPGSPGDTEPGYLAGIHAEHRAILHAIQAQDPAAAAQAMRAHIQQSLARRRAAFPKKPAAAGRRS